MFLRPLGHLKTQFPETQIDLICQKGIGQKMIYPDALFVGNEWELKEFDHDFIFHVHFPMSEYDKDPVPKAEKCCIEELGIEPVSGHLLCPDLPESRLVGLSFQATALPERASAPRPVAEKMWDEVVAAGFVPIEVMMEHRYHNPVNSKYGFINCTMRGAEARLDSMMSVISRCYAFLGVSSGPVHLALSLLPHDRVGYIEKDFKLISITKEPLRIFNINHYRDGEIKAWLNTLSL
jgi:hypothetical protein